MTPRRIALFALLVAPLALAAPVPKALKRKSTLNGRWVTVERVIGGPDIAKEQPWVWDIEGERLTTYDLKPDATLTPTHPNDTIDLFPPDPSKPMELDYLYKSGSTRMLWRGRMKWDGDEFVICFGEVDKDRPTEVTNDRSVYSYYRFKRMPEK